MTVAVLAPVAAGDPGRYGILAAALAVAVGIICLAGGIARLGFLADLLSRPVLVGYMTGIAVIMIASQVGKVTGTKVSGDDFVGQVRSFAADIAALHWPTIALAAAVLTLLFALARWAPRVPGPLSLDTPIGLWSEVGRSTEMPCRGGRMRFLEDQIRPQRRASRRCNYLTFAPSRQRASMTRTWCPARAWSRWSH